MYNVSIYNRQNKSMLTRSLPESLSVVSTVSSAKAEMKIEQFETLVLAKLDRKRNPHNLQ